MATNVKPYKAKVPRLIVLQQNHDLTWTFREEFIFWLLTSARISSALFLLHYFPLYCLLPCLVCKVKPWNLLLSRINFGSSHITSGGILATILSWSNFWRAHFSRDGSILVSAYIRFFRLRPLRFVKLRASCHWAICILRSMIIWTDAFPGRSYLCEMTPTFKPFANLSPECTARVKANAKISMTNIQSENYDDGEITCWNVSPSSSARLSLTERLGYWSVLKCSCSFCKQNDEHQLSRWSKAV